MVKIKAKRKKPPKTLINSICKVLASKKAEEIKVIDTSKITSEFDYMIIATASSKYQIDAMVDELEKFIEEKNLKILAKDDNSETGWVVFDLIHTIIHIMLPEVKEYYSLERIWEIPE